MEEINQSLFLKLNSFTNTNSMLDFLGIIGAEYMPIVFIIIEIYLFFFKKKKNIAIFAFMNMLLALGINQVIGWFYYHNRPFVDGLGNTIVHHVAENSFPSDHSTFMFAIAVYLYLKFDNKILGEILLLLSLIGGLLRVFVGVHYPFDIVGSIFVSLIAFIIINKYEYKLQIFNDFIIKIEERIFKKI
jgi:undecaprenyl-diphosphatase